MTNPGGKSILTVQTLLLSTGLTLITGILLGCAGMWLVTAIAGIVVSNRVTYQLPPLEELNEILGGNETSLYEAIDEYLKSRIDAGMTPEEVDELLLPITREQHKYFGEGGRDVYEYKMADGYLMYTFDAIFVDGGLYEAQFTCLGDLSFYYVTDGEKEGWRKKLRERRAKK